MNQPANVCLRCGSEHGVAMECSRTMYEPTERDPTPNAPIPLCRGCAKDHHEYWDEMWNEYRAGLL